PVCRVVRITLLDEIHRGKIALDKNLRVPERVIGVPVLNIGRAPDHGLKNQLAGDLFYELIESKQGITQVIENTHKQHVVELAGQLVDSIDRALAQSDVEAQCLGGKTRLT